MKTNSCYYLIIKLLFSDKIYVTSLTSTVVIYNSNIIDIGNTYL